MYSSFCITQLARGWFCHQPLPVIENAQVKVLWDFSMVTDARISCNRPNIVVFLKQEKRILFLEVSCPADVNVVEKEEEKVQKYHALASELSHCYE